MTTRLLLLLCWLLSAVALAAEPPLQNRLAGHASPYLAQHGADPVAWQEWNAETLARARRENKPLFVSVGYFACHWCHVMQRESYRDPAIAALLNRHFIPVKVDRELNGALDAALAGFSEQVNGLSGWPLNAVITPEGYPLLAVLYLPPKEIHGLLQRLSQAWTTRSAELQARARPAAAPPKPPSAEATAEARAAQRQAFLKAIRHNADTLQGGFSQVSKFPLPSHLSRLLEEQATRPAPEQADFLTLTLDQMARRGLRDVVNGGFFRYTTDPDWATPHFEKMLADNTQLALVYARAAEVLGRPDYRVLAHETLDFLLRDLRAPAGDFLTALSALDRRGREGGSYLWSAAALRRRLPPALWPAARQAWRLDKPAPFDLGYLPVAGGLSPAQLAGLTAPLRKAARRAPADAKRNAGLNGLTLSALSLAGRGEARFEQAARTLRATLERDYLVQGRLIRTRAGTRVFPAAELEDYAYVAAGLADFGRVFKDGEAEALSRRLLRDAWSRFFSPDGWRREEGALLATDQPLPALPDGALPSPSHRLMALTRAGLALHPEAEWGAWLKQAEELALPAMAAEPFEHPGGVD